MTGEPAVKRRYRLTVIVGVLSVLVMAITVTAVIFAVLAYQTAQNSVAQVKHDEHTTKEAAAFTRAMQVKGEPISVCLLDVLRNVAPLLERVPTVERPLQTYVRLQGARYPGVTCPEKP